MDELISIGQFAALTWLSPKALRLYQAQGILEPGVVDPARVTAATRPTRCPWPLHPVWAAGPLGGE